MLDPLLGEKDTSFSGQKFSSRQDRMDGPRIPPLCPPRNGTGDYACVASRPWLSPAPGKVASRELTSRPASTLLPLSRSRLPQARYYPP